MMRLQNGISRAKWSGLWSAMALLLASCGAVPEGRDMGGATRSAPVQATASGQACFNELARDNVRFTALPNQRFSGGCSQIDAIKVVDMGAPVTNLGPVKCELARNFARWTEFAVKRAAMLHLGTPLARIETMGSYSCRNIAGSAKLSQHAHANAIDISAFVLADGRRISVEDGWRGRSDERAFLSAIHKSACRRFGTVLSPNYNAAHRDHFHFDMSGNGYCR